MTSDVKFPTFDISYIQVTANTVQQKSQELLENINERFQFLIEFFKDPFMNGSIVPSSIQLTERVVQFIPEKSLFQDNQQRRYLEVGPGTGPFTKGIVERLKNSDHLDIVELNPSYCDLLKKKFADKQNVHVHCLSITDWNPEYKYDAVISGLPLNGFSPELVEQCLKVFKKVTKQDGTISYFDYPNVAKFWNTILIGKKKEKLEKILEIKDRFFQTYGFKVETVENNFPTANVFHFRISDTNGTATQAV